MAKQDLIRDFQSGDADDLSRIAVAAFAQYASHYTDWPTMAVGIAGMPRLADVGQLIVAEHDGRLAGGVAYIPSGAPKADYFDPSWAIVRMLVIDPDARGRGLGRALTEECVRRARRDRAPAIALHTSPIMEVALPMYLRTGFGFLRDAPAIHGVPYGVYLRSLKA